MDQSKNSLYNYLWGPPLIRLSEILADFSRELGYEVYHFDLPDTFKSVDDYNTFDLVSFGKDRDGITPTNLVEVHTPCWCVIQTFYDDQGRIGCLAEIELLKYIKNDYSKIVLYPSDPEIFAKLTAFLDHWYFVIFQKD